MIFPAKVSANPKGRGNPVLSKQSERTLFKFPVKLAADWRTLLAQEKESPEDRQRRNEKKKEMVNNLISDLLDQTCTDDGLQLSDCNAMDMRIYVPKAMPAPNGFISSLDAEDESLFRYFCFGKPSIWISTKKFNRDVPWCLVPHLLYPAPLGFMSPDHLVRAFTSE